ncbi:MAG: PQQ-dependent sugar dehydrogenase [Anaerolineales bacterium]|nr:PQQ-dependent sugar dehydrogenase [Anaerolineales bacterium]
MEYLIQAIPWWKDFRLPDVTKTIILNSAQMAGYTWAWVPLATPAPKQMQRNATIMRFNIETGEKEIYASGMRNPFDIAFHPLTGELFATDNGRDDLGLGAPQEELNLIIQNGDYGFPNCWDSQDAPGCEGTIPAVAFFEPHSSADGLDFYTGTQFPNEYQNNAL